MDEAILIEIAARFRQLEDAVERADKTLKSSQEYHEREARNNAPSESTYGKRAFERHSNASVGIEDDRAALEQTVDACRSDMERMQNTIRSNRR